MYKNRSVWITFAVIALAAVPLFTAWPPLVPLLPTPSKIYRGNHAFLHETGMHHPYGWEADFRLHRPGYFIRGLQSGGDRLSDGTYRYDFYFALRPGHLGGLLSNANDVVRLEVTDASSHEVLLERTFQMADFKGGRKGLMRKPIIFSTAERGGHLFEPRIYWEGLSGIFLQRVELVRLETDAPSVLRQKASDFEQMMQGLFLERGFVVTRDARGEPSETGDAAIWTGLYAAAEAQRYKVTQDADALKHLEQSLWALHSLCKAAPLPGTLVRYVDSEGKVFEQPPSKDTYTGFFYGAAQALPYVRNPALRKALQSDMEALVNHFLDHDLSFVPPYGTAVDMKPYPSHAFVAEAVQDLQQDASLRRDLAKTFQFARWYFLIHGQRPPPSLARAVKALHHPSAAELESLWLPLLNDTRLALKEVQENVHRSALRGPREGLSDTPYIKLDLLLLRALRNLDADTGGRPFSSLEELKVLPSQSLHALHFLKVAAETLPKPNRFDAYYRANLYDGKALLRTAVQWHQIDEDAVAAVLGQTEVDTRRTASSHLSYLALHDLILLEKDPLVRFKYQKLFEQQYQPMRQDGNAMIDAMHAAVGLSAKQLGLAWWSLARYPVDRRGKGDRYWEMNRNQLLVEFGSMVNGQAREVLPPDLRPRDAFIWQRSAHSIRGDQEGWLYPPLDYLFAYWLAINSDNRPAVTEKS